MLAWLSTMSKVLENVWAKPKKMLYMKKIPLTGQFASSYFLLAEKILWPQPLIMDRWFCNLKSKLLVSDVEKIDMSLEIKTIFSPTSIVWFDLLVFCVAIQVDSSKLMVCLEYFSDYDYRKTKIEWQKKTSSDHFSHGVYIAMTSLA